MNTKMKRIVHNRREGGEDGVATAGELELFDAHCHLDWFSDPAHVAADAMTRGLGFFAVTVTPDGYRTAVPALADAPGVALAAGLHPWWLADGRAGAEDVDALCALVAKTRWVGEVGLDFSTAHADSADTQVAALTRICSAAADTSDPAHPHVLSLHAVRATNTVLDVLEATHAAERCRCVLHWFSGSTPELWRAVHTGCWLSFGERSLATRRGREYARILPAERLLTETDLPPAPGAELGAADVAASLERALTGIAEVRGTDMRAQLAANAAALLA